MTELRDLKETYNRSIEKKVWKLHSYWKNKKLSSFPSTSIVKYWIDNGIESLQNVGSIDEYFNAINKESKKYVKYCAVKVKEFGDKTDGFTEEELTDLQNFFKGYMGEYFFIETFVRRHHGSLFIKNRNYSDYSARTYDYCAPLHDVHDFGIDGTCISNDGKNCVIQVKFWNNYNDDSVMKMSVLQKAYCEGVVHRFIDPYETDNVIICWLGKENKVTSFLKENKDLAEHIVFVDHDVINKSLQNDTMFWSDTFVNSMQDLCKMS